MARPFDATETWVRKQNVARHPGFDVKDYPIKMDDDSMTVGRVITDVLAGVQKQSDQLYNKSGTEPKCSLVLDPNGAVTVTLTGKKNGSINKTIVVPHVDMELEVDGSYVLAQYVTSRLCHGIGDYFCGMKDQATNWDHIGTDIVNCVNLMHIIENPPKNKQPKPPKPQPPPPPPRPPPKEQSEDTKRFIASIQTALGTSRLKNSGYSKKLQDTAAEWIKQMQDNIDDIPVNVQIDIREIACDKVAVYAKERPIGSGKVFDVAQVKSARLLINHATSCIDWVRSDLTQMTYGPYKNIVSTDSNTELFDRNSQNTTDNLAGLLAKGTEGGGLEYDAIRTLANGIDVVLFGYGHSGTGKTFSLFGNGKEVTGSLQLILANVAHVKLRHVFEEAPGGKFEFAEDTVEPNYDGHIIRLYEANKKNPFNLLTISDGTPVDAKTCKKRAHGSNRDRVFIDRYLTPVNKNNVDTSIGIIAYINEITMLRRKELRIRATLNNGQSSRSHLYMVMDVWCGNDKPSSSPPTSRLTVIDLGGIETPDSMIESAIKHIAKEWGVDLQRNQRTKKLRSTLDKAKARESVQNTVFTSRLIDRVQGRNTKFKYEIVSTISTCYATLMNAAPISLQKELKETYEACLITDLVAAYRDITDHYVTALQNTTSSNKEDAFKTRIKTLKSSTLVRVMADGMNPFAKQFSLNPIQVMYPTSDRNSPTQTNQLLKPPPDRVPPSEIIGKDYFSLFHLAALYIEGSYIVESLQQMKQYLRNDPCAPKNGSVLTKQILQSLTNDRLARHIMLFTMCPVKMQAEQDDSDAFDKNFMQPAKFVQDVCSTVNAEDTVSAQDETEDEPDGDDNKDIWVQEPNQ